MNLGVLWLSLFFCYVASEKVLLGPMDLVHEIIDRFDRMIETSVDAVEKLQLIKETTAAFIKLGVPLGGLLLASLSIATKTESPEYRALTKLNQHMNEQFAFLHDRVKMSFKIDKMDNAFNEFHGKVTMKLNVLEEQYCKFTDPQQTKTSDSVDELLPLCRGDSGVTQIAEYIRGKVMDGCWLNHTMVHVKTNQMFSLLTYTYNVTQWNTSEKKSCNVVIRKVLHSNNPTESLKQLDKIKLSLQNSEYSNLEDAMHKIEIFIRTNRSRFPNNCLTDILFSGSDYDRERVRYYNELIIIELARLMMSTHLCGRFMYEKDEGEFQQFLTGISAKIIKTAEFLVDYVPQKLNQTSHGVEQEVVTNVIRDYPGFPHDIPYREYRNLGRLIHKALKNVGISSIEKQILVVPSSKFDPTFSEHFECPLYWCSLVLHQRCVSVMITRFPQSGEDFAQSLENRRDELQPKVYDVLKTHYSDHLPQIVEILNEKNITLVTPWARSGAIIRQTVFCLLDCVFPSFAYSYTIYPSITASADFKDIFSSGSKKMVVAAAKSQGPIVGGYIN